MSLDITYRPRTYDAVLGQASTATILRRYITSGKGFHQSYIFCGERGRGKTTMGRILVRALLCEAPVDGEPCDKCVSCESLLEGGSSMDYVEVDAASSSGKDDVAKIIDELQYATFSGKRRIYLFDEAHQLTKGALDALLKPMEEPVDKQGGDKQLICIFCTTEPERMRTTVLSRCAPIFVIRPVKPATIAERLAFVCEAEGISADLDMLTLIAEITECHIRDAYKAVEGVSMLGAINKENVTSYLHLDLNTVYVDLIDAIGVDLPAAFEAASNIMQRASPLTCYEKLAEVAMLGFRASMGEVVPAYWQRDRLIALGKAKGISLLGYASRFASRPGRPTAAMLHMDIAHLHHAGGSVTHPTAVLEVHSSPVVSQSTVAPRAALAPVPTQAAPVDTYKAPVVRTELDMSPPADVAPQDAAWVAASRGKAANRTASTPPPQQQGVSIRKTASALLEPSAFSDMLQKTLMEMSGGS